jgi:hypothetical protein
VTRDEYNNAIFATLTLVVLFGGYGFAFGRLTAPDDRPSPTDKSITVTIPDCQEDEPWLYGTGDFDGRRWDQYICVHQDEVESP